MNMNSRERKLLLITIGALGLLAANYLILNPLIDGWKKDAETIEELSKDIDHAELLISQGDSWKRRMTDYTKRSLPKKVSQAEEEIIRELNTLSAESKINVATIKPSWKYSRKRSPRCELKLSATGSYEQLLTFINAVEVSKQPLRFNDIRITSDKKRPAFMSLDAELETIVNRIKKGKK